MGEEVWLNATDAMELLRFAVSHASNRKSRLFTCACARSVLPFIVGVEAIEVIEVAERRAAEQPSDENRVRAFEVSCHHRLRSTNADFCLARVLEATVTINDPSAATTALRNVIDFQMEARGHADAGFHLALVREVFGNPFRPVDFAPWRTDTAVALARQMYDARDFSAMPILADALQEAGCDNDEVLSHCRDPKQVHVRGCWVVDGVLGLS